MTTIAYRDGVLATDSRSMLDGTIVDTDTRKLFRDGEGGVFAFCGDVELAIAVISLIIEGFAHERLNNRATIVHLRADGTLHEMSDKHFVQLRGPLYAWGTGHQAALAAMILKASAVDAIRAARQVDPNTGGAVKSFKLNDKRKGPRRRKK